MKRVCFIYRKHADTPSIERVFRILSNEFEKHGIEIVAARLPFGNDLAGLVGNLLFFRFPDADIYHITGHIHYIALRAPENKTVLTVHDLGILRVRSGFRRMIIKKIFFDWPFKRLSLLAAISQATKSEMITVTGCDPEKITVIGDPVDPVLTSQIREFNTSKPTILQVGTAPHKNLDTLIEAVKGMSCRLLIAGKVDEVTADRLRHYRIEFDSMTAGTDQEMRNLYQQADIVAFCSTFEGFGLPIIEAQSMGVPMITSNFPPMNDVAGKGAILVDPYDAAQIRRAIEQIATDAKLRDKIIDEGRKNISRFESSKIAGEYLNLYLRIGDTNKL